MRTIFFFIISINCALAQVLTPTLDTIIRQGAEVDTMIIRSSPHIVSKPLEITQIEKQTVNHFFYLKPNIAYLYFYNNYFCQDCQVLAQAFTYSVKEMGGFTYGLDVGYKYKNYNILLGYTGFTFFESVYDYKRNITDRNNYSQNLIQAKFLYEIKILNFFTLGPWLGLGFDLFDFSNTTYPIMVNEKVTFVKSDNYHIPHSFSANAGVEFRFFNSSPVSPYIAYGFSKSFTGQVNSTQYHVGLDQYVSTMIVGLLIKF